MTHSPSMIGRIGATAVEQWAAQGGITTNASAHDEKGWDFLLQLPASDGRPSGPLDQLPPELTCMVQVKTSLGSDRSAAIKLSNWKRMCTDPIPWFVIAIRLSLDTHQPIETHLVHIDGAWCSKVLKRLRELGSEEHDNLHKHTLNVSWSEPEELTEPFGTDIKRRLRESVVPDQHTYVMQKVRWFQELGYSDKARRISIHVPGTNPTELYSTLAELAIGERSTFPKGWRASISDVRFGVEATLREFDAELGEMEYHAPAQGELRLELQSAGGRSVALDCKAFRARAVFPFLPDEFDFVRLVSEDVVVRLLPEHLGTERVLVATFKFSLPRGSVSISSLKRVVDLSQLLIDHDKDPVKLSLANTETEAAIGLGGTISFEPSVRDTIVTLGAALRVCAFFGVSDETKVDPDDLESQAKWSRFMDCVSAGRDGEMRAPFDRPINIGECFGVITEAPLYLPDRVLVLLIGAYGRVTECREIPAKGAAILVREGHMILRKCVLNEANDPEPVLRDYRDALKKELHELGCTYLLDHELHEKLTSSPAV